MNTEKKLLRVFNDMLGAVRAEAPLMAYLKARAEASKSSWAVAAYEMLEGGSPWIKVQVLLDVIRRYMWPNRVLILSLYDQIKTAETDAHKAAFRERLEAIAREDVQQGAKLGGDMVIQALKETDVSLPRLKVIVMGMHMLNSLAKPIAEAENWDSEEMGPKLFRVFH